MTATIGQVQLIPNTNGSLGRVVSVYPLYQVDPTEAVSAVQLQAIERAAAARVAANPRPAASSSSPGASVGDGAVDPATLLAAQAALPAGQLDSATASAVAQAAAQAATRTVQRTEVSGGAFKTEQQMDSGEKAQLAELRARDASVRKEEQTHAATAGVYAGSPQYKFERGPDGRQYAVEGSVSVKISAATLSSPEKAAAALKTIQDAALSPENPSAGDLSVFTQARAAEASNRYKQSQALAQKGAAASDGSADGGTAAEDTAGSDGTDQTDSSTAGTDNSHDDSWLPPGALPEWKREKELSLSV
ncbi:putative metalloprotease CJM1_0395 family protein [Radicibacter daui]|uniref:putative metalloprotease CJM1_0395 family protein n=1 Tax=Radicibacter daui TaxID=3064829 RepID=UPI004047000C